MLAHEDRTIPASDPSRPARDERRPEGGLTVRRSAMLTVGVVVNLWLSDTVVFRREWKPGNSLETWFVEDAGCPPRS